MQPLYRVFVDGVVYVKGFWSLADLYAHEWQPGEMYEIRDQDGRVCHRFIGQATRLAQSAVAVSDANGWDGERFVRELRGDFLIQTLGRLLADRCRENPTAEEMAVLSRLDELFPEDKSIHRCRYCRGDETAYACECV